MFHRSFNEKPLTKGPEMPRSRAELAIQKEAIRIITTVVERAASAKKTPREVLEADPFLLGQTTMLTNIFLSANYDMNIDIPDNLIDVLL
jgi:hypothetical protein